MSWMLRLFLLLITLAGVASCSFLGANNAQIGKKESMTANTVAAPLSSSSLEDRAEALLRQLTLEEKIQLCHGCSNMEVGDIPRLGIGKLGMSDGPQGVRLEDGRHATALPCGISLSCTWNPEAARAFGALIGREIRATGNHVILGPGVNLMRTPLCGRNFEYYGEDPYLSGQIAAAYIRGVQSEGAAATVKHLAANNQEICRTVGSSNLDERTLREIYLVPFEAAVKEGRVWCIMSSYNKINGVYASQNALVQETIPKKEWGFDGVMMSDWGGAHDTKACALGGLDLEMGQGMDSLMGKPLLNLVRRGEISEAAIDEKVRRVLRLMLRTGLLDPPESRPAGSFNTQEHHLEARRLAGEGMVLLKNDSAFLPLQKEKIQTLAVIGPNAARTHCIGKLHDCGGSGAVHPDYEITPLEGLRNYLGVGVKIVFAEGVSFAKPPEGTSDGARDKASKDALFAQAIEAAQQADAVLFFGGTNHSYDTEALGWGDVKTADIPNLELIGPQARLIRELAAINPCVAVVLINGSAVSVEPWIDNVSAVLEAWYPGMESGNAIAEVLFGQVNPSGKLSCTFGRRLEDYACHANGSYPGVREGGNPFVEYKEGIFMGYRWFDRESIKPRFPFGFGLSYTTFGLKNAEAAIRNASAENPRVTISVEVANTGTREGAEVVQVYVGDAQSSVPRPVRELKGFQKVFLKPGESKTVTIDLGFRSFAFWDANSHLWNVEPGEFRIGIGTSSRDIHYEKTVTLTGAAAAL